MSEQRVSSFRIDVDLTDFNSAEEVRLDLETAMREWMPYGATKVSYL